MKKVLFFILCGLFTSFAHGQEGNATDTLSYTEKQDIAFAPLNKSRIPSNIFYDRVFPFAGLTQIASGDTVSVTRWIQGFSELQRARYGPAVSDSFLNPGNIRDFVKSENHQNKIPLLLLDATFASFDLNAIADGRLDTAGGLFHDGTNGASPYLEHRVVLPAMM